MDFFKALFHKDKPAPPTPPRNVPGIEPIVVQAVENLFPDANTQTKTFACIREFKRDRKGIANPETILALLKYSNGDLELFRKSAWQSHPHFWMDEINHIFAQWMMRKNGSGRYQNRKFEKNDVVLASRKDTF